MPKVAIVGAGGLVGSKLVACFEASDIPELDLVLTGKEKSVGTQVPFRGKSLRVETNSIERLRAVDIVVLCTPTTVSGELVETLRGGPIVVDTSSFYRMDEEVPLVVPEVNPHALEGHKGLIAGPNCSTIQLVMVLKPLHDKYGLKRVHVATYQSVSGVGYRAVRQLEEDTFQRLCAGKSAKIPNSQSPHGEFPHEIAFNVIPQVDSFLPDGYTKEEMKMVQETRKILGLPELAISCTCARVPVFVGHSEDCLVETENPVDLDDVRTLLSESPGIVVMDDFRNQEYPMPCMVEGRHEVYVGRIRQDLSREDGTGLLLWVVADNLLRGAATNACNIVRLLLQ